MSRPSWRMLSLLLTACLASASPLTQSASARSLLQDSAADAKNAEPTPAAFLDWLSSGAAVQGSPAVLDRLRDDRLKSGLEPSDALIAGWTDATRRVTQRPDLRAMITYAWTDYVAWIRRRTDAGALREGVQFLVEQREQLAPLLETEDLMLTFFEAQLRRASGEMAPALASLESLLDGRLTTAVDTDPALAAYRDYVRALVEKELMAAYLELGQPRAARDRLESVPETGWWPGEKSVWSARIALDQRQFSRALRTLERIPEEAQAASGTARIYTEGIARLRQGDARRAQELLATVVEKTGESSTRRANAALGLIEAYRALGEYDAAEALLKRFETACLETPLFKVRWLLQKDELSAARAAQPGSQPGLPLDTLPIIRAAYQDWLAAWSETPIVPSGVRFVGSERRRDVLAGIVSAELRRDQGERQALARLVEAQACGTLARRLGASTPTVSALQKHLKRDGSGALIFVPLADSALAFAVDGARVSVFRLETPGDADELNRKLRASLGREASAGAQGDESAAEFTRLAAQASAWLLPDEVASAIKGWSSVHVVGLDLLTRLPAPLLRLNGGGWLGCAMATDEWPSVPVGLHLAARGEALKSAVAIIDPALPKEFKEPRLPFSAEVLDRLDAALGKGGQRFSADEATVESLLSGEADLAYLHCHGRIERGTLRPARLLLAGDNGVLSASRIESLYADRRAPRQVILAACQAGYGRVQLGEDGADQLAAAFFVVGTRAVLAARHDLFHGPTRDLVIAYLEALQTGSGPGEALRRARITLARQGADPRDFGLLQLVGG